jgi:zinc transport system substrate-binding protein
MCGCSKNEESEENVNIYTTVYPVTYITSKLYGENNIVKSIYPNGVDLKTYKLTKKQIKEYSSVNMFVYIGAGSEKDIAKSFLNNNKDLEIIDASYGLSYDNKIEELWIAPNNFLMLAKNIKASLNEYIDNEFILNSIENNYDEIYKDTSWLDAELRTIAKESEENNSNTIITKSNVFEYLTNYGFNVISLDNITNNEKSDIKSKFKNGTYSSILKLDTESNSSFMDELVENYSAKVVSINSMITNDDSSSDYKTIQSENINKIREIVQN